MEHIKIINLKTMDMVNPYGIDDTTPSFAWQMESNVIGQKQTAYQIIVTTDDNMVNVVWNSDKILSDKSIGIKYDGEELKSSTTYYWRVKVWDKDDKSVVSSKAKFTMGLLEDDAWNDIPFINVGPLPIQEGTNYVAEGEFTVDKSNSIGLVFNYMDDTNMAMWQLDNSHKEENKVTLRMYLWINLGVRNDRDCEHSEITSAYVGRCVNLTDKLGIESSDVSEIPVNIRVDVDNHNIKTYVNSMIVDTVAVAEIKGFVPYMGCVGARVFRRQIGNIHTLKLVDYSQKPDGEVITNYNFSDYALRTPNPLTQGVSVNGKIQLGVKAEKNVPAIATNFKTGAKIFRKEFTANKDLKSAILYATAKGLYEAYINGKRIGELQKDGTTLYDELKPGYTDGHCRFLYQSYDITHILTGRTNTLSAIVTNGRWADDVNNNIGDFDTSFAMQLRITYVDDSTDIIKTDDTWKAYYGSNISYGDIYHGEIYDANADSSWMKNGYDTSLWAKALPKAYEGMISAAPAQNCRIRMDLERKPIQIVVYNSSIGEDSTRYGVIDNKKYYKTDETFTIKKGETAIVDFGQNFAGWEKMEFEGSKGTEIVIRHAEMLNDNGGLKSRGNDGPEGSVYVDNLRSAKATSVYKMSGNSTEIYHPTHTYYGFRYLEISPSDDVIIKKIRGQVLTSIKTDTGYIVTSDKSVNQLFANTKWGQYSNYLSIITDCPQRDERQGWGGDAQVFSITGAYNAATYGFVSKWMQDMRDSQSRQKNGTYGCTAPYWTATGADNRSTAWADAGIIVPYNMYEMYGDKSIIEENYASMQKYVDGYSHGIGDNIYHPVGRGCERDYGDWLFDELNTIEMKEYLGTVYLAWDYQMMAKMAAVMNKEKDAVKYQLWFDEVKVYFNEKYVNADGSLKLTQPTAYLYALKLGLLNDKASKKIVLNALVERIKKNGNKLETGFLGTAILLQTLTDFGRGDIAYKLLLQRQNPSWLYTVDQGATTVWERWNSYSKEYGYGDVSMNSFNHFSFGVVCEWMYSYMSGIMHDFENPGFKHIILQPIIDASGKITFTEGEYISSYGKIESNWKKEEDVLYYSAVVPANAMATLYLPVTGDLTMQEVYGVKYIGREKHNGIDCMKFELLSGGYDFVVINEDVEVSLRDGYII